MGLLSMTGCKMKFAVIAIFVTLCLSVCTGSQTEHVAWKRDAASTFEVGTQIRAWTIREEGMDYILDNMQSMCGVNNLYMVVVMHQEHRPYQAPEFPHNPDTREYAVALFGDLAANYDLDYIQTCQYLFNNRDIDEGGTCFCEHCIAEARKSDFDMKAAITVLQANKNAQPQRDNWLAFRRKCSTEFYRVISEKIREGNPKCHLRYNDTHSYGRHDPKDYGLYLNEAAPYLGSLVNQDHEEQKGNANEMFKWRKEWLERNRAYIGPDMPLLCGIGARIKATPELIKRGIKAALESPAKIDGLVLKHYDGASFSHMRAFKQGMIEGGVKGLAPTIGKEVEEMKLDGYTRIDGEFVEEWGVETQGTGTASYSFDNASGTYDVRITYFDENEGQGRVTLYIAGTKKASFKLDEDVDCWRWRRFENIQVNHGDEINLVGQADRAERVRLDFIEFIPRKRLR